MALSVSLTGCGTSESDGTERTDGPSTLSSEAYVAHVAALAAAGEEGLSGDAALRRAVELGAGEYSREEVERFAGAMRERPREWAELERRVDERIRELKTGGA